MRVRLEDLAEAAGVSVTTVSRVLGGRGKVAASTRERVLDAVDRLGYSRSTLLRRTPAHLIAVCAPASPEHWQLAVCRAVSEQLQSEGMLISSPFLSPELAEVRASVAAGASVIVSPTFTRFDVDVPVVRFAEATFEEQALPPTGAPAVGSEWVAARLDLTGGLVRAFEHLTALGHRRIGLISNETGALAEQLERRFLAEHPARSISSRLDEWIARVPKSYSGGIEAALRLRGATCTAIIVQSALQLHGVFAAMRQRRLVVPRDLSVVGFGDSATMRYTDPPATVLAFDNLGMSGALAAGVRSVLDLPGERMTSVAPNFRPVLMARSSTAAARS
ncbi:LacI family DNA-binding transcriptional regulator [Brevibacterium daeguense]|uniref:LacI family DNA-binding transcriptional regulator n=1 Tax=Brevibacterium daeguense TaxID=909936 RepID=A0ABP8EGY3_9MICO|nr:LacI family DNA-binding transcriptional regulator [Brevibacterium daeguense]